VDQIKLRISRIQKPQPSKATKYFVPIPGQLTPNLIKGSENHKNKNMAKLRWVFWDYLEYNDALLMSMNAFKISSMLIASYFD